MSAERRQFGACGGQRSRQWSATSLRLPALPRALLMLSTYRQRPPQPLQAHQPAALTRSTQPRASRPPLPLPVARSTGLQPISFVSRYQRSKNMQAWSRAAGSLWSACSSAGRLAARSFASEAAAGGRPKLGSGQHLAAAAGSDGGGWALAAVQRPIGSGWACLATALVG